MPQDEGRQILNIFRIHFGPVTLEERPDFREAGPADDGARRRPEVDAALDQVGRRVNQ
jgi:hypothetical protein